MRYVYSRILTTRGLTHAEAALLAAEEAALKQAAVISRRKRPLPFPAEAAKRARLEGEWERDDAADNMMYVNSASPTRGPFIMHTPRAQQGSPTTFDQSNVQAVTNPHLATRLSVADCGMEDTDENTPEDAVMQLSPAEKETLTELEGRCVHTLEYLFTHLCTDRCIHGHDTVCQVEGSCCRYGYPGALQDSAFPAQ